MNNIIKEVLETVTRREQLCKNSPKCTKCGTNQVQLLEWEEDPTWKCRHCKHIMK